MPAYIIAHLTVTDPVAFDKYRALVPKVVEQFGGRYAVRGGTVEVLEGDWAVPRLVILEFDGIAEARRFYHSSEYQELLPMRLAAAEGPVVIVEGA